VKNEDYTYRAKQFKRDDFWKQVRRTVNGEDAADGQIALIVDQIMTNLQPSPKAKLVDVGCGNGVLTNLVGGHYKNVLGIDPSNYLIEIAKEFFKNRTLNFFVGEAID
jgi:2-polyprenyl-3-methyl-5-hydroxy-6-metoxy-1,4-benzoquinol methylase